MYESFYKLHSKPFRLSPDPSFFYPSSGHKRALSYLLYGLNQGEGFVVITGAPGTGKTTLAHKLLSQIDTSNILVAHLSSTQVEAEDLLRLVAISFKLRSENVSKAGLIKDIESFLLARSRERKRCLLVVDEAQNLPERSIEELRMLSNFQVSGIALLQIFLLGQEQFRAMLENPDLEQLNQRVIANFHLNPLDVIETQRYVEARLRQSGWTNDPHIADGAYPVIYSHTTGLPRRINMFCDRLLLFAYMEGLHVITRDTVASVIEELKVDVTNRGNKVVFAAVDRTAPKPLEAAEPAVTPPWSRSEKVPVSDTASVAVPAPTAAKPSGEGAAGTVARPKPSFPPATDTAVPSRAPAPVYPRPLPAEVPRIAAARPADAPLPQLLQVDRSSINVDLDLARIGALPNSALSTVPWRRWPALLGAIPVMLIIGYWFYPDFETGDTPKSRRAPIQRQEIAVPEQAPRLERDDSGKEDVSTIASSGEQERIQRATDPLSVESTLADKTATKSSNGTAPGSRRVESQFPALEQTDRKNVAPEREPPKSTARRTDLEPAPPASELKTAGAAKPSPPTRAQPAPKSREPEPQPATIAATQRPAFIETAPPSEAVRNVPKPDAPAAPVITQPVSTSLLAPPPVTTTPEAEPLAQLELAQLLLKFTRYYEEGNLEAFVQLLADDVRTEDQSNVEGVRNEYRELFQKTVSRQIQLGDIRWTTTGRTAKGAGPFEVRIRSRADEPPRSFNGTITFHVEKKVNELRITALFHAAQ